LFTDELENKIPTCILVWLLEKKDTHRHMVIPYRGTLLIRNQPPIGSYSRSMLRALRRS